MLVSLIPSLIFHFFSFGEQDIKDLDIQAQLHMWEKLDVNAQKKAQKSPENLY